MVRFAFSNWQYRVQYLCNPLSHPYSHFDLITVVEIVENQNQKNTCTHDGQVRDEWLQEWNIIASVQCVFISIVVLPTFPWLKLLQQQQQHFHQFHFLECVFKFLISNIHHWESHIFFSTLDRIFFLVCVHFSSFIC